MHALHGNTSPAGTAGPACAAEDPEASPPVGALGQPALPGGGCLVATVTSGVLSEEGLYVAAHAGGPTEPHATAQTAEAFGPTDGPSSVPVDVFAAPGAPVPDCEGHPLGSEDECSLDRIDGATERMCMTATLWTVSNIMSIMQLRSALNLLASKEPVSSVSSVSSLIFESPRALDGGG